MGSVESDTARMIECEKGLGNKVPANFFESARGSVTAVGPRCLESGRCNSGQTSLNTIPSAPSYFQNVSWPALRDEKRKREEEEEQEACVEASKLSVRAFPFFLHARFPSTISTPMPVKPRVNLNSRLGWTLRDLPVRSRRSLIAPSIHFSRIEQVFANSFVRHLFQTTPALRRSKNEISTGSERNLISNDHPSPCTNFLPRSFPVFSHGFITRLLRSARLFVPSRKIHGNSKIAAQFNPERDKRIANVTRIKVLREIKIGR